MFSFIMFLCAFVLVTVSVRQFIKQIKFINNGTIKKARIVELQSFSYITYDSEKNRLYNFDINPILELDIGNNKIRVDYHNYDDMRDISEGQEVDVIYPEGHLDKLIRYSKFSLLKKPFEIGATAIVIFILALIIL